MMQKAGKKAEKRGARSVFRPEQSRFGAMSFSISETVQESRSESLRGLHALNLMHLPLKPSVKNEIIDELSKEIGPSDIEKALADCPMFLFTTVARGKVIVKYHKKGLLPITILKEANRCQDDILLDKLLELSLKIQKGEGIIRNPSIELKLQLLKNYSPNDIYNSFIKIPFFMLSNNDIGFQLTDHLIRGGVDDDVYIAYNFERRYPGELKDILQTLFSITPELRKRLMTLNQNQLNAILTERSYLISEMLWSNAVELVKTEKSEEEAIRALELHRNFGYRRDFRALSEERSLSAKKELVENRSLEVEMDAEIRRNEAVSSIRPDAEKKLSKKEKQQLHKERPQMFSDAWDAAHKKLNKEIERLSLSKIDTINQKEIEQKENISHFEGPEKERQVFSQYQEYFAKVNFHPDALKALDKSGGDMFLATSIIQIINTSPDAEHLLLKVLTMQQIKNLFSIEPNSLPRLLQYGVDQTAIYEIAHERENILIVNDSIEIGLNVERINAIAHNLIELKKYVHIRNINDLDLFRKYEPVDIIKLSRAFKNPLGGQIDFLLKIFDKSDNTESMIYILNLCKEFEWKSDDIINCLAKARPNSSKDDLKKIVCSSHLARYNKDSEFRAWLHAVGQLVDNYYTTISPASVWIKLPSKKMETWEITYTVTPSNLQFVVHYHPGTKQASVKHPHASDSHFKPFRGVIGTQNRVDFDEAPKSIKDRTQKSPQK